MKKDKKIKDPQILSSTRIIVPAVRFLSWCTVEVELKLCIFALKLPGE